MRRDLDDPGIARWRMAAQRLWGDPLPSAPAVLREMAALQGQEFGPARWSIAQRTADAGAALVDQLFADGVILRTHLLRPTWHLFLAEDARWLLEASRDRVQARNAPIYARLELDAELLWRSASILEASLRGGRQLTRRQLAEELAAAGIMASGPRLAHILMHAELEALICSGAPAGSQQTYALFDERVPPAPRLDRQAARVELARRFFRSRGPATLADFRTWASLLAADARAALDAVTPELQREVIGTRTFWFAPPPMEVAIERPRMDLVQVYDEVVGAYPDSNEVMYAPGVDRGRARMRPPLLHTVLLDGQVIGHWNQARKRGALEISTWFYRRLTDGEETALAAAADRLGRFTGMSASLRLIEG